MTEPRKEFTFDRVVRMVLTAAIAVGLFLLLRYMSDVLIPFAAAVVLAYLLNPLVTVFERKTKHRGTAVALALSGVTIFVIAAVVLIVPLMLAQIDRFSEDLARLRADFVASVAPADPPAALPPATAEAGDEIAGPISKTDLGWEELTAAWEVYRAEGEAGVPRAQRLRKLRHAISGTYIGNAAEELIAYTGSSEFRQWVLGFLQQLAAGGITVLGFLISVVIGIVGLVIVLLYLVFLLLDYPAYAQAWPGFIPPAYRAQTVEFFVAFNAVLRRYFRGQAVVALLVGALTALGYTIIGLPMAVPFGLFIGLLNMVPYLPSVAIVPAILLAGLRAIGSDASFLGSVGLVFAVNITVQIIQDGILTPRIMGQATGLRPVSILLGLFIWGKLLGFLGLLLAIPLTCLFIAYYRRYVLKVPTDLLVDPPKKGRRGKPKAEPLAEPASA